MQTQQNRYECLDLLRGISAFGVMTFHLSILGVSAARHGYLAVDLFFILSGFVLAHAYSDRLSSIGFGAFVKLRLIRIMPLSIFGLLLGTAYFVLRNITQPQSLYSLVDIASGTVFNIFLLPKPWTSVALTDTTFPTNTPLWSLSLELITNFVWAYGLFRAKTAVLAVITVFSAALLLFFILQHGNADIGATWGTYLGGVSRVTFGFFAGVLIWRFRPTQNWPAWTALFAASALIGVMLIDNSGPIFDFFVVIFVFPVIVTMASATNVGNGNYLLRVIGDISYPLYVVHVPIFMTVAGLSKLLQIGDQTYLAAVSVFLTVVVAVAVDRIYDRPLRRAMNRMTASHGAKLYKQA